VNGACPAGRIGSDFVWKSDLRDGSLRLRQMRLFLRTARR
jgi:hypothetical protein